MIQMERKKTLFESHTKDNGRIANEGSPRNIGDNST